MTDRVLAWLRAPWWGAPRWMYFIPGAALGWHLSQIEWGSARDD